MKLPDAFSQQMQKMLANDFEDFISALSEPAPTSVRVHSIKQNNLGTKGTISWCPLGYYLNERPIFTLDPSFHAGSYYVQEASSMLLWYILEQISGNSQDPVILDLCAAPGGKSSLIANFIKNSGTLVANEVVKSRANVLKYNLMKEGYPNVIVTQNDPSDFKSLTGFFDIILADVPCSGEGMFRKDPKSVLEWSPTHVEHCSSRQKRIINDILPSLKEGGFLIYSTCTYNKLENIDNINWICNEYGMESIPFELPESWKISTVESGSAVGYQCLPHKVRGEGFFISVLRNKRKSDTLVSKEKRETIKKTEKKLDPIFDEWFRKDGYETFLLQNGNVIVINPSILPLINLMALHLYIAQAGITAGHINKSVFTPDHSLALSLLELKSPKIELTRQQALLYLKKELPSLEIDEKSWFLACYNGNGLGWLKNLGNRINNYLPSNYRILMDIYQDPR